MMELRTTSHLAAADSVYFSSKRSKTAAAMPNGRLKIITAIKELGVLR